MAGSCIHSVRWWQLLVAGAIAGVASASAGDVVVRGARCFDGERAVRRCEVRIADGVLTAVRRRVKPREGDEVVDAAGFTLLPGLIDAHVHVHSADHLRQAAMFGVTTELDMFGSPTTIRALRQLAAHDVLADVRTAGIGVTAPGGHGTEYGVPIPTLGPGVDVAAFVTARVDEGSDYVKIIYDDGAAVGIDPPFPTLTRQQLGEVVVAAHALHRLAVVHIGSADGAMDALQSGADGLAHLYLDRDEPGLADVASTRSAFVVPTLSVLASGTVHGSAAGVAADPRLAPFLFEAERIGMSRTFAASSLDFAVASRATWALAEAGVDVLAGTDAPNPGTAHGVSMHHELELLVGAGLTEVQALAAATSVPARRFGLDDRGRLAVGLRADLLLVRGDPTRDITATRAVEAVWVGGRRLDRAPRRSAVGEETAKIEAQRARPAPVGSESGEISAFDDGLEAAFGRGWVASSDAMFGGSSTAEIAVQDGVLIVEGEVGAGFPSAPWSGVSFWAGPTLAQPANLSAHSELVFRVRKDAGDDFFVGWFAARHGPRPLVVPIRATADWTDVRIPLARFEGIDGRDTLGFVIAASAVGDVRFAVDDVHLE